MPAPQRQGKIRRLFEAGTTDTLLQVELNRFAESLRPLLFFL